MRKPILGLMLFLAPAAALAGEADVVDVRASKGAGGTYRFDVTVRHADAGWDHYADAWDVVGPGGAVLGTRILAHPHDTEQPFTRSLSGVKIPAGVNEVTIRARDKVHEYGGAEFKLKLP